MSDSSSKSGGTQHPSSNVGDRQSPPKGDANVGTQKSSATPEKPNLPANPSNDNAAASGFVTPEQKCIKKPVTLNAPISEKKYVSRQPSNVPTMSKDKFLALLEENGPL